MSEFKGTPGPWQITRNQYSEYCSTENCELAIKGNDGEMNLVVAGVVSDCIDEHKANANLIAAAPDLLQTLQTLVDRIDYYASLPDRGEVNIEDWAYTAGSDDMNAARAALAKALGQ